jgi:hypothetical protein
MALACRRFCLVHYIHYNMKHFAKDACFFSALTLSLMQLLHDCYEKTGTQLTVTESAEKRPRSCSASTSPLRQRAASRIGYATTAAAGTATAIGTTAVRHLVTASVSPRPVRTTHTASSSSTAGTGTAAATTLRTSSCNVAAFQSLCLSSATVVSTVVQTVVPTVELPKHVLAAIAKADAAAAAAANNSTSSAPRALCSAGSSSTGTTSSSSSSSSGVHSSSKSVGATSIVRRAPTATAAAAVKHAWGNGRTVTVAEVKRSTVAVTTDVKRSKLPVIGAQPPARAGA